MNHAARVTDLHSCPAASPLPHVGGVIGGPGETTVVIANMAAATQGTTCVCPSGPSNGIAGGSSSVLIAHKGAARMGDATTHGGTITVGCATVLIGG